MKRIVLLLTVLLSMLVSSACAHNTNVDERLLHKAELAYFDDDDDSKAFEYITEFLDTYPNHVDGRYIRARIYYSNDKNDLAIRDIKVAIKKHNKNSRVYLSTLYDFLACIYDDIDQMDEAVKAVRREQPEKLCSFMFDLGQYYYNKGQIDEADNVFQSILKEDDTYQTVMVGLARNCMRRQKYDKGLEWLELAKKYDNDYSQIYRFEMQILKAMGRGKEAIDSAIKYCLTDKDAEIDALTEYIGLGHSYGIAKLKNAFRGTSDMRLPHIMALIKQYKGRPVEKVVL